MQEVRFTNRFGIELAGHLYLPANSEGKRNQAIAVAGPFGGVKKWLPGSMRRNLQGWVLCSRSIGKGMMDSYTEAQKNAVREYVSKNRWKDVDAGQYGYGPHEITVSDDNQVIIPGGTPDPSQLLPFVMRFAEYYFGMAKHERAIGVWDTVDRF